MRIKVNAGIVLGTVALIVSCCVAGVVAYDHRKDFDFLPNSSRPMSAAEVEANTKVRLPAGTTLLGAIFESIAGGLETRVVAQFRFARTALPQFLADSGLAEPTPGLREVTDKDLPGSDTWHPDAITTVSGIKGNEPYQGIYRRLLIDLGHAQDVTVYLVASKP